MSMYMNMKERKRREKQLEKIDKWMEMDKTVIVYNPSGCIMGKGKAFYADYKSILLMIGDEEHKDIQVCRGWHKVKLDN